MTSVMCFLLLGSALQPLSVIAEDNSTLMVSPLISKKDNQIIIDYHLITNKAKGTAEEIKQLKRSKLDTSLLKLESDEAKAILCRIHGDNATAEKDYVEAMRTYQHLIDNYPDTSRHAIYLQELLYLAGRADDNATKLSAALAVEKLDIESSEKLNAMRQAAAAFISLKQFSSAVEIAEELHKKFPQDTERALELMNNIGVELVLAGQLPSAQRVLEATYLNTPPEARGDALLGNLANISRKSGNIDQAIKYQEEAIRLFPEHENVPAYQFAIANSLFDLGQYEESKKYFQAVLSTDTPSEDLTNLKNLSSENIKKIELVTRKAPIRKERKGRSQGGSFNVLLVFNVVAAIVVLTIMLWRRKHKSSEQ